MSNWIFIGIVVLVVAVILLPRMSRISASKAKSLLDSGAILIDVRSPAEFQGGSAEGAINIPLSELKKHVRDAGIPKDQAILLFCASGARSGMAKRQLESIGYSEVHNLGSVAQARKSVLSDQ